MRATTALIESLQADLKYARESWTLVDKKLSEVQAERDQLDAKNAALAGEVQDLRGLVTSTKDGPCEPTLEGIAKFLTGHVGDESQTLLLVHLMLIRIAVHLGLPVSMPQLESEKVERAEQRAFRLAHVVEQIYIETTTVHRQEDPIVFRRLLDKISEIARQALSPKGVRE